MANVGWEDGDFCIACCERPAISGPYAPSDLVGACHLVGGGVCGASCCRERRVEGHPVGERRMEGHLVWERRLEGHLVWERLVCLGLFLKLSINLKLI